MVLLPASFALHFRNRVVGGVHDTVADRTLFHSLELLRDVLLPVIYRLEEGTIPVRQEGGNR